MKQSGSAHSADHSAPRFFGDDGHGRHTAQVAVLKVNPSYRAYQILHATFAVGLMVAGADKFLHWLTNWDQYLAPTVSRLFPLSGHEFMFLAGTVEVLVGLVVAFHPRLGSYLVAAWLLAVIINLLLLPGHFDIALRDLGLMLGALALAKLAEDYHSGNAEIIEQDFTRGRPHTLNS